MLEKHIATIRLERNNDGNWHMYHCPDCGLYMFRHNGDLLHSEPGNAPLTLGIEIACKNKHCGKVIIVEGFATKV